MSYCIYVPLDSQIMPLLIHRDLAAVCLFYRYARNADNYEMVMTAARHYWNACVPLVSQPIERELLREPIKMILQCITATAEKIKKKEVI